MGISTYEGNSIADAIRKDLSQIIFGSVMMLVNTILLFVQLHSLKVLSKNASRHNTALTVALVVIAYEIVNFITNPGKVLPRTWMLSYFPLRSIR
ncbi:MAG: hypothetical protein IJU42_02875 [Erysipelotrichaceae bacterium]|nr:hypothetical protein [Erysipelotrichaceae bacterium]